MDADQQATLITLMWIGRGDYDISEWQAAYSAAKQSLFTTSAASFLGKPQLADFVEEGLNLYDNCKAKDKA